MYHLLNTRCYPNYCHNGFIETGVLGHMYVQLMLVAFKKQNSVQVSARAMSIMNMEK